MAAISHPFQAALLLALISGCARGDGAETPHLEYVSSTYGYSVSYPDSLDLREFAPQDVAIGYSAGDAFDVRVELVVQTGTGEEFGQFAREQARAACADEAPGISI